MMDEQLARISELIEPWFIFALVWTVGGTVDTDGRHKFSVYLIEKMKKEEVRMDIYSVSHKNKTGTEKTVLFGICF